MPIPDGGAQTPWAVAASSSGSAVVFKGHANSYTKVTSVLHLDGGQWRYEPLPEPMPWWKEASVAAASPGAAWIGGVDMYAKTPGSWHWDGARWTRVDVPFDGPFAGRMAVAAEPGGTAWGLLTGFYRNPLDDRVFRFEGGRWVQQDVPLPPQETTELTSIAAGSAENVWIAGVTSDGQGPPCRSRSAGTVRAGSGTT
ncbi:hypothetical protein GEV43_09245 [Actinomadura sp. J1-007]|uniref:hypothetical protein n=1 Tax=Actinomadura sp. J1-007 TaxID=2661913 RepID=UPI001326A3CE|nr:hypothetical protein [Actinomadura sp. J1-007]MWK34209.1 hypothetical protein [Actinomadura sp. J1-007]